MGEKIQVKSTNGNEKLAAQIDEIYAKIDFIENLLNDLKPAFEKISKDIQPTIKDLREKFEGDESLELVKKVGDNIPTFLTLMNLMDTVKGMIEDFAPVIEKISKDTMPTVNMLRESFEKEETLELLKKTGENITTFNKLMDFLNKFEKTGTLDFTLENVLTSEMNCMIKGMEKCAVISMKHIIENPIKPGIKNVISAMRDPEVQKGLLMMTIFAKNLSQGMSEAIKGCK
jgi:uncharacterized protein YjgD (DUF1641 family)